MAPRARRRTRRAPTARAASLACLLLFAAPAGAAEGPEFRVRVTPEYSSGRYGEAQRTEVMSVPLDIGLSWERWTATLRLPWLSVTGPGGFVPRIGALGPAPVGGGAAGSPGRRTTTTGVGDMRLTGAYTLFQGGDEPFAPYLDLALQTRFPTASSAELGSGQVEHILRLDTGMALGGGVALDASLGRRVVPFPRRGGGGRDYWTLFATLGWDVTEATTIGLGLDTQDRVPEANRAVLELGAFLDHELAPGLVGSLFVWHGVTRESAAIAAGFRLAWRGRP